MAFHRAANLIMHGTPRVRCSRRVALRRGFTLLELVVVLIVAATIAAIAAPRFADSAARGRVLSGADRLGAEIVLTRDRTRAASSARILRMAPGTGTIRTFNAGESSLGVVELNVEPYLTTVVRTDLPGNQLEFTAYALPTNAGRVMLRSGVYVAVVSIASDGTVSRSAETRARDASPLMSDVVAQLGANLSVREIAASPGNVITSISAGTGK